MWKAYTREKPARRGWAVGCMAIAFVGTLALAQMQIADTSMPEWDTERTVNLEDWSISIDLPTGFNWKSDAKGMSLSDQATYTGSSIETGTVTVSVSMLRDAADPTSPVLSQFGPPDGRLANCSTNGTYWYVDGRVYGTTDFKVVVLPNPRDHRMMIIDVASDKSPQYNGWIAQWITESIACP